MSSPAATSAGRSSTLVPGRAAPSAAALPNPALRSFIRQGVRSATLIGGIPVIYLFGIPVQAFVTGVDLGTTALSSIVFLPGDLAKAVVTAVVAQQVHKARPGLIAPLRGHRASAA